MVWEINDSKELDVKTNKIIELLKTKLNFNDEETLKYWNELIEKADNNNLTHVEFYDYIIKLIYKMEIKNEQ